MVSGFSRDVSGERSPITGMLINVGSVSAREQQQRALQLQQNASQLNTAWQTYWDDPNLQKTFTEEEYAKIVSAPASLRETVASKIISKKQGTTISFTEKQRQEETLSKVISITSDIKSLKGTKQQEYKSTVPAGYLQYNLSPFPQKDYSTTYSPAPPMQDINFISSTDIEQGQLRGERREFEQQHPIRSKIDILNIGDYWLKERKLLTDKYNKSSLVNLGKYPAYAFQGVGIGAIGLGTGVINLVTSPGKTLESSYTGTMNALSNLPATYEKAKTSFIKNPFLETGKFAGSLAVFYGLRFLAIKGFDIARTIGAKTRPIEKLTYERVLSGEEPYAQAPPKTHLQIFKEKEFQLPAEVYTGTRYSKGKWKPIEINELPSNVFVRTAGFHATAKPIKSDIVLRGESEFKGMFIAPQVSVPFLRANREKLALIGLDFGIARPIGYQVYPTRFVKGLSAKLGEAFVPSELYGKSEIQGIVTESTRYFDVGGGIRGFRYYTKYGGRRVPLPEIVTINEKEVPNLLKEFPQAKEISINKIYKSSYSVPGTYSFINPLSFGAYLYSTKSSKNNFSYSSMNSRINNYARSFSSATSGNYSRIVSSFSYVPSKIPSSYSSPSYPQPYRPSRYLPYPPSDYFTPPPKVPKKDLPSYGDIIKARRLPARRITEYTPSYGALVFNIKGKPAKKTALGYTGIELRPIPKEFNYGKLFRKVKRRRIRKGEYF